MKKCHVIAFILLFSLLFLISGCQNQEKGNTQNLANDALTAIPKLADCAGTSKVDNDLCITKVAVYNKDKSTCNSTSLQFKYECLAQVAAKGDKCFELKPKALVASCFEYQAFQLNDVSFCDRIKEINLTGWDVQRDYCYLDYYGFRNVTGLFPKNTDISINICAKLLSDDGRNYCFYVVAHTAMDDSICDQMVVQTTGDGQSRDTCYSDIAMQKNRANLCDKISDKNKQQNCNFRIAVNTNQASICEKIPAEGNQQQSICLVQVAAKTKDKTVCDKITDSYDQKWCLRAAETGNLNS